MRAYTSLRRRSDFARVTRRGKRRSGAFFTLFIADGRGQTRVGITVSSAIGNAVIRNRLRRRVKAILDAAALGTPPVRDLVFIARPGAGALEFPALRAEIGRLCS